VSGSIDPRAVRVTIEDAEPLVVTVVPPSGPAKKGSPTLVDGRPIGARLEVGEGGRATLHGEGDQRRLTYADLPAGEAGSSWSGVRRFEIVVDGWRFVATVEPAARAALRERARRSAAGTAVHHPGVVRAPIPGRIVAVHVAAGEQVEAGRALVSLEAMKMENAVRAPRPGTISRVAVAAGGTVELGDTLVELA